MVIDRERVLSASMPSPLSRMLLGVLSLVAELDPCDAPTSRIYDFVEGFCGAGQLYNQVELNGFTAIGLDKSIHVDHDILTDVGWRRWVTVVLMMKENAVLWLAPLCSSWVWIGRSGTRRSKSRPHGDARVKRVRDGNKIVDRCVVLSLIAHFRGLNVVVENPKGSLMFTYKPMMSLVEFMLGRKLTIYMGAWGGDTDKCMLLRTNWLMADALHTKHPRLRQSRDTRLVANVGRGVKGIRKRLKQSQSYTSQFGQQVALLVDAHFNDPRGVSEVVGQLTKHDEFTTRAQIDNNVGIAAVHLGCGLSIV